MVLVLGILVLILVQFLFYAIQDINSKKTNIIILSLLKDEKISSNPYTVSQMLQSMENSGLIKCTRLGNSNEQKIYFTSVSSENCYSNLWSLEGKRVSVSYKSVSGLYWDLEYLSLNPVLFRTFLNISRLASLTLLLLIAWFVYTREKIKDMRLQLLNKESLVLHQVLHDIRSPVFVLNKIMSSDFSNIDKDKLLKYSLGRIQSTLDDIYLKSKNEYKINMEIDLSEMINSIVTEKKVQFKNVANISLENKIDGSVYISVNGSDLERVLSNLINNAVEAGGPSPRAFITLQSSVEEVEIVISDGGYGFPKEIINKVGQERVTQGKQNLKDSGSGLGLLHAFQKIKEMDGIIEIQSSENGSNVIIKFKTFNVHTCSSEIIDFLYVEDDAMMCYMWEQAAKKNNVNLKIINHPSQIDDCLHLMDKDKTKVYSDSSFADANGEDLLLKLYEQGYRKLYLTTGYSLEKFKNEKRFNVLGKIIPF